MAQRLVIGSAAMAYHLPNSRTPKDLDVFSPHPMPEAADVFWHPDFESWIPEGTSRYAGLDELYTLKVSHSYWHIPGTSWEKHIEDAARLKRAGGRIIEPLHSMLYKVWEEKHGVKRVNLVQTKDEFFADAVVRIYDHDSIHYSVAYGERPLYESVFKDGPDSVQMDMAKVKALPFDQCVKLFREEIYATALERWIIPSDYTASPSLAYARALRKTITSLTKGWSARFLVENYEVFRRADIDYVAWHKANKHKLIRLEAA